MKQDPLYKLIIRRQPVFTDSQIEGIIQKEDRWTLICKFIDGNSSSSTLNANVTPNIVDNKEMEKLRAFNAKTYLNIYNVGLICPACNTQDVHYQQKQDRSGDEGMTAYCTCNNKLCRYTWHMRV